MALTTTMILKTNYFFRYLGVTLDPRFNWSKYVDNVTDKENSTLGFIWRNILTNSEVVKNMAYNYVI